VVEYNGNGRLVLIWAKLTENLAMWNVIAHFDHSQPLYPERLLNIFFIPEDAQVF